MTNAERADHARAALEAYCKAAGLPVDPSNLTDLICDLLHLEEEEHNSDDAAFASHTMGAEHYAAETACQACRGVMPDSDEYHTCMEA